MQREWRHKASTDVLCSAVTKLLLEREQAETSVMLRKIHSTPGTDYLTQNVQEKHFFSGESLTNWWKKWLLFFGATLNLSTMTLTSKDRMSDATCSVSQCYSTKVLINLSDPLLLSFIPLHTSSMAVQKLWINMVAKWPLCTAGNGVRISTILTFQNLCSLRPFNLLDLLRKYPRDGNSPGFLHSCNADLSKCTDCTGRYGLLCSSQCCNPLPWIITALIRISGKLRDSYGVWFGFQFPLTWKNSRPELGSFYSVFALQLCCVSVLWGL